MVPRMIPRNLRHRLEKAAKLLVIVQKYLPEASCRFADEQGNHGHLIIHLPRGGDGAKLAADLEGKGFTFTRTRNPWLGLMTYKGVKDDQPAVLIEIETAADRLYQGGSGTPEPISFKA